MNDSLKIILLSDTHSFLQESAFSFLAEADEIWHAGDIGDIKLIDRLAQIKPVRAVHGNIDDQTVRLEYPQDLFFTIQGLRFWMTHIGGYSEHYHPSVKKILEQQPPDVFICGHSHILRVMRDKKYNNMLTLNPGAAGEHGFHSVKTMLRFSIANGKIDNMEVIELGKRGKIS